MKGGLHTDEHYGRRGQYRASTSPIRLISCRTISISAVHGDFKRCGARSCRRWRPSIQPSHRLSKRRRCAKRQNAVRSRAGFSTARRRSTGDQRRGGSDQAHRFAGGRPTCWSCSGETIGLKTLISRCDDASARCSASSRPDLPSVSSTCTPPCTILQLSTPSRVTVHAPDLPSCQGGEPLARGRCGRMSPCSRRIFQISRWPSDRSTCAYPSRDGIRQ
jgi:hypothetical protein